MSTAKTAKAAAEGEKAAQETINRLKDRVKELEHEVSTLKSRLDGLRKAKNTTITKREREVLEVGFKRDPHYEAKIEELEKQLRAKSGASSKDIEELKKQHAAAMAEEERKRKDLQKQLDELYERLERERKDFTDRLDKLKNKPPCNHEEELYALRTKCAGLEGDNSALMLENKDLKDRVNALCLELSVKEAKWCEKEEQYKLKLKQRGGDRYEDWMRETEQKIKTLQEANHVLRTYLHRSGQRVPGDSSTDDR